MTNVAGHLREQNGMYQMILSWKDTDGKRRTKSISTGLPVKGNKKRAESLLRKTQKEFNPETMQQVSDLPVSEYLNRWLRESVMNLPPETYGRYAYDLGRVVVPYFEKKRLSLKALSPRDLETFFRYERQQEEASVQQLLDWHKELTDALQYAVDNNWLKVSPIKEVDPCLDNSPVLFTDFITDWLKMMKSRVEITTYTSYERAIVHKIVPYFEPLHYTLQDMEQHPKYIQDFYQHELDRGLTANTVIHYHANIRKCLQYAFQIGMIRSNPADRVERPRKEKFKSEIYSGEELEQLFKVIQGDPSEFGVIMAAFYGLRRSEIVGLKWDAIDFENKKISIQHTVVTAKVNGTVTEIARDKTKTKSSCRTLPLIPACEQMLNKMKKEQEQNRKVCGKSYCTDYLDYIYVDPMGKRIRPDFLSQHFPDFLVAHQMKRIRFHDLRHIFATMSLEHGMDVKTLSAIIGHVSAKTTLNIYTHITNEMQENAAASIDRGIAKAEISRQKAEAASEAQRFEPYTPPRRRPGTGYIKQLKEDLWEGRYSPVWPDGKKHSRNVYGHTREECEEKLAKLILQMKAEIAVLRNGTAAEYPDGVSPKKKQLAEYLRQHPGVSNKSYIARETGMDRTTVQKYYDEVRAELAAPANT